MAEGRARAEGSGTRPAPLRVVVAEPPTEALSRLELLTTNHRGLELAAHVTSANDALSAIKALSSLRGSAAIVSLALPGPRDAFWLIRSIRDRFPSLPILACHIGADETTISRAFFAGADGYVDTTAGSARFMNALRQVAAGELVLQDSSTPEPESPEEEPPAAEGEEEPITEEQPQPATEVEPGVVDAADAQPAVPGAAIETEAAIPGASGPAALVTKRAHQEKPQRWFGRRRERRKHPAPEAPPRVDEEPPPRPSPVPEEPVPEPKRPTKIQPRRPFEPLEEPAPPRPEAGPDAASETVWAPGAEWDAELEAQGRSRPSAPIPTAPPAHPAPETVWADEREVADATPPEVAVQPQPQAEPVAAAEPEPVAVDDLPPEPVAVDDLPPEPVAVDDLPPEPVAAPEPEPESRPELATIVAVAPSPTLGRELSGILGRAPGDILRLPTVKAAESFLTDHPDSSSVLIAFPEIKDADAIGLADFALQRSPATAIVLVREHSTGTLFQAAMRAGVRELVDLSVGGEELLRDAVERAFAWSRGLRSTRREDETSAAKGTAEGVLVSVFSSKGGTGKTFLAANLAAAVASKSGQDTAILDLDLEAGDVFSYFGREVQGGPEELMAVGGSGEPADVIRAGTPLGAELFGYAAHSEVGRATRITSEATGKLLGALRKTFAYTIVDSSGSYTDQALAALELSDRICLVSTNDVAGPRYLERAMDTLQSLGLGRERLLFVLNRADGKIDPTDAELKELVKLRVDARIPSSTQVPVSLSKGRPICLETPSADVSKAIERLADVVVSLRPAAARRDGKGVFFRR